MGKGGSCIGKLANEHIHKDRSEVVIRTLLAGVGFMRDGVGVG